MHGNRVATDDRVRNKEAARLSDAPSGLSPPTVRPSLGAEQRASMSSDRSVHHTADAISHNVRVCPEITFTNSWSETSWHVARWCSSGRHGTRAAAGVPFNWASTSCPVYITHHAFPPEGGVSMDGESTGIEVVRPHSSTKSCAVWKIRPKPRSLN